MDMPLVRTEPFEMVLRSFARKALRQSHLDDDMHPGQIRIFCQKKILDEEVKEGWGYFVIEKPRDASPQDDGGETQNVMDFYIYEESE